MEDSLSVGSRVKHPKMNEWGIGQVVALEQTSTTVFFEFVGEKKIRTDIIKLIPVAGAKAESAKLDSKFRTQRAKRRRFSGPRYFNDGKSFSRKKFIESLGGVCSNWNWSWSFVNHDEKKVFYGAWQDFCVEDRALIFSESWKTKYGKKRASWPESRENLRLVEEEGYSLNVYTMIADPDSELEYEKGARKIGAILNDLTEAKLKKEGGEWFAVFPRKTMS